MASASCSSTTPSATLDPPGGSRWWSSGPSSWPSPNHRGPHDDIDVTYGRLGAWVVDHALAVDGPIHETYLVGPRDTPIAAEWRTEIGWPIFRLAPD